MDNKETTVEENLKKALCEMLILALLCEREYHVPELTLAVLNKSGGTVSIMCPYVVLYRMLDQGYIQELPKRIAPDGRRRQYYSATEKGREYFKQIYQTYKNFIAGVNQLLESTGVDRGDVI